MIVLYVLANSDFNSNFSYNFFQKSSKLFDLICDFNGLWMGVCDVLAKTEQETAPDVRAKVVCKQTFDMHSSSSIGSREL